MLAILNLILFLIALAHAFSAFFIVGSVPVGIMFSFLALICFPDFKASSKKNSGCCYLKGNVGCCRK